MLLFHVSLRTATLSSEVTWNPRGGTAEGFHQLHSLAGGLSALFGRGTAERNGPDKAGRRHEVPQEASKHGLVGCFQLLVQRPPPLRKWRGC